MGGRTRIEGDGVASASALIVAAGKGERLGSALPKAFVEVGGRPMIAWSIDAFLAAGVAEIVIAMPPAGALPDGFVASASDPAEVRAAAELVLPKGVRTVPGGAERSHSVRAALAASTGDPILVHDAARPLVTPDFVEAGVVALTAEPYETAAAADPSAAAERAAAAPSAEPVAPVRAASPKGSARGGESGLAAAIIAAPVTDTIKHSADGVHVDGTLVRSELWAVQTPQVFRRSWLERALAEPGEVLAAATDDASIVESLGGRVALVSAPGPNLKVTTPHDLTVAELFLGQR